MRSVFNFGQSACASCQARKRMARCAQKNDLGMLCSSLFIAESNPDLYLNYDLKGGVHSVQATRNKKQLKQKVSKSMFQRKPARVRKYFKHEKIRYCA